MTKETKVAMLLTLCFLIVVGILLSDYIQTSTVSPTARLTDAGGTVRLSVNSPGDSELPVKLVAVNPVQPSGPIPMENELRQQSARIEVGGPPAGGLLGNGIVVEQAGGGAGVGTNNVVPVVEPVIEPVRLAGASVPAEGTSAQPTGTNANPFANQGGTGELSLTLAGGTTVSANAGGVQTGVTTTGGSVPLEQKQNDIRAVLGSGSAGVSAGGGNVGGNGSVINPVSAGATRKYTAKEGDTLGRIALKTLGANTKANRDAIAKVNPGLAARPDVIVAGRSYVIPGNDGGSAVASSARSGNEGATAATGQPVQAGASSTVVYTVKSGDNLWKIAKRELGDGNAVAQIKALNKDVLKNSDELQPDMKLRLPVRDGSAVATTAE